jgi:glycosyltransferase involved in cell wall biosynthesis
MNKILFIGNIQYGMLPTGGGAQARNQIFLKYLQKRFGDVSFYDTWHKNKIVSLFAILFKIVFSKREKIILSLSFNGVYILAKILTKLKIKRNIYYWVIGGGIANHTKQRENEAKRYLSYFYQIIVQAKCIKADFEVLGIKNVTVVPNFKNIDYIPAKKEKGNDVASRFVYLSRLIEEKGVGLIIKAAKELKEKKFEIDFYGTPSPTYSKNYFETLGLPNIHYKGFLDLQKKENYDLLATYDVMLFPTYFNGEGFPGILIDAFIAGLPVIASNFYANPEVIINGKNGILVPPENWKKLKEVMNGFITGKYDLKVMQMEALSSANQYNVYNVLNEALFAELGIL